MTRIQTRVLAVNSAAVLLALLVPAAIADSARPANDRSEIEWSAAESGPSLMLGLPPGRVASRVSERRDELVGAAGVPALGDLSGGVTVVEFFDYRCGYCKRSLDAVRGALLLAGVRVEMREYPILGAGSVRAARAALAAARQGAYEAAHVALMEHDGEFDAAAIDSIMRGLELDMDRLAVDMESEEIEGLIEANRELARRLGVTGTPAFLVLGPGGVEVSPGALDADRLAGIIDAAG